MQGKTHSMQGDQANRALRVHLGASYDQGSVVLHDGSSLIKGIPIDVSQTGLFVKTHELPFELGQHVQATVKIPGVLRSFSQECVVARQSSDARFPIGFGLRFISVPNEIREFFGEENASGWGEVFLLTPEQKNRKILLVDSDQVFAQSFQGYVANKGLAIDAVEHLGLLPDLRAIDHYDTLVVGYDAEPFSGMEIAEILMKYLPHKPIVLLTMSRKPWETTCQETPNVVGISNKWDGHRTILSELLKIK